MNGYIPFNRIQQVTNALSPYSFVVPPNVFVLDIEGWGPGAGGSGGGGGASTGATPGGGGGGAQGTNGQYVHCPMMVVPGETLTITVPAGGAAGSGGTGGTNAVGGNGTDGADGADVTIVGSLQTITIKGGKAVQFSGASTPRGKGGAATTGGAAGTAPPTYVATITGNTGSVAVTVTTTTVAAPAAGASNASGGGGGPGAAPVPSYGAIISVSASQVSPSGTTAGTGQVISSNDIRGLFGGSVTVNGGNGGAGNGSNNGAQGTDTSTRPGYGGAGGGGGGGRTAASGKAGDGAAGRQGGPGLVNIGYCV